jgi:hypothetical protein
MTEQTATVGAAAGIPLRTLIQYLASALPSSVRVVGHPDDPFGLVLASGRDSRAAFQLESWSEETYARRSPGKRRAVIWVVRRGRPDLRSALRDANQNYIDVRGAVRLHLPWLLIDRTDLRPLAMPSTLGTDAFADRSSLVVRSLLAETAQYVWGVRDLAASAGVGIATASRVIKQLYDAGLVQRRLGAGNRAEVRVISPSRLFDRWTDVYSWNRNAMLAVHAPIGDPMAFIGRLKALMWKDRRWALSLHAGAAFVFPHATWDRIHLYVDARDAGELTALAIANRWPAGDDGRLVLMRPYYRTSIWSGIRTLERDAVSAPVVDDLQLALDLWHYPLRGREQASVIRDGRLRSVWKE